MSASAPTGFIPEETIRLWYPTDGARPRCEVHGDRCILQARLYRCYPLSEPARYVGIHDGGGKEVGIVRDPARLDPDSCRVLESELDRVYFTPGIERIVSLRQEASMWRWEVETQRGVAAFYLRGVRDSVHEVAPGRWQIYSVDGQRYEIREFQGLDAKSQSLFESLF